MHFDRSRKKDEKTKLNGLRSRARARVFRHKSNQINKCEKGRNVRGDDIQRCKQIEQKMKKLKQIVLFILIQATGIFFFFSLATISIRSADHLAYCRF